MDTTVHRISSSEYGVPLYTTRNITSKQVYVFQKFYCPSHETATILSFREKLLHLKTISAGKANWPVDACFPEVIAYAAGLDTEY